MREVDDKKRQRLTVGLPVFNDAVGLRRSIPSVMGQRWNGGIHLLIVDDGSTDDTPAVLSEMAFRSQSITVVRNRRNTGRARVRNQILDNVATDYLAWIDSDDVWYPDKLQRQFDVLQARPDDLGVLCTCAYKLVWVDRGDESLRKPRLAGDQLKNFLDGSLYPYLWTMLGRTETFRDVGRFSERLARRQDYEFILRFLSSGGEIVSPDPTVPLCEYYRTDIGRSGWEVAAANRWIWKRHRRVFSRYKRLYAYDRRATQHALSARFFLANGQWLPGIYYTVRRKIAEARVRSLRRFEPPKAESFDATDEKESRAEEAVEQKLRIFGTGLSAPPLPVDSCDVQALEQEYQERGLWNEADTFVLYRIIGNDLQPRHAKGQAFGNLKFILEHEQPLPDCEKRWIVNRVFDADEEQRIMHLLEAHDQPNIRVPFEKDEYRRVGLDFKPFPEPGVFWRSPYHRLGAGDMRRIMMGVFRSKNLYVMNNNGARNLALEDGRGRAKWILPWDGNCFLTAGAWNEIRRRIMERPVFKYVLVPMARISDNCLLLAGDFSPPAEEEPQIVFRRDAAEPFDEAWPYGRRPKMELFWRLGVPWKTEHWKNQPWDPELPGLSPEAGQYQFAGWVARLCSESPEYDHASHRSFLQRSIARETAVIETLERLDTSMLRATNEALAVDSARLETQTSSQKFTRAIAQLADEADKALTRAPRSVLDKLVTPVGSLQDYWFPAPYWWPNPNTLNGRPYVRTSERRPGTQLFGPGSERYDRSRLQRLCDDTLVLALAHRITGRDKYARHAAKLLRCWFLDEATRMTPHLEYAEVRLGHSHDRGGGRGVIQTQAFWYLLEGIRMLRQDSAIDTEDVTGLNAWFRQYLDWLLLSKQGRWAQARTDFHGACYELQITSIAAFVGAPATVVQSMYRAEEKVHHQFHALAGRGGTAPERLSFTLHAWSNLHFLTHGFGKGFLEIDSVRRNVRLGFEALWSELGASAGNAGKSTGWHQVAPLAAAYEACFGTGLPIAMSGDCEACSMTPATLSLHGIRPFWMLG